MNISDFDSSINNSDLISKIDNTFVMLFSSIMFGDLSRVYHKISKKIIDKYQPIVNELKLKNQRQMYDELNVKSTTIDKIYNDEDNNVIVEVTLESGYMDYIIDKETGKKISGINDRRIEHINKLVFKKLCNTNSLKTVRHCPNCGNNLDINSDGRCNYCDSIFNLEDYDYILEDIEIR